MERIWRPDWPCPAGQILAPSRRGPLDPTYRIDRAGRHWRGMRTPEGPATLMVEPRPGAGEVRGEAWGDGADWALAQMPALLGADDDVTGFEARHPVLVEAQRRHPHWRIGRTGLVMEALVPSVIEQKVTGQEALAGFRHLVLRFGERAPGPHERLWLQPSPEQIRGIPSWAWLQLHIDPARSRTLVTAASRAAAIERIAKDAPEVADRKLRSLPGVGVWTSAEVRAVALGDADAVSFGDYHVAKDVGWALLGREIDDDALADLLEPWRPHRLRVQGLVGLAGLHRPRRGPRMAARTHLPAQSSGRSGVSTASVKRR